MDQEMKSKARQVIENCMCPSFATVDESGCPQTREMMAAAVEDDFTTFYITSRGSAKCAQITANPKASSLWSHVTDPMTKWSEVLVKGKARVSDEKALRDRFWMEPLRGFFPGGADDPNFVIIVVEPTELIFASNEKMGPEVVKL